MERDYPEAHIMKQIKELGKSIAATNLATTNPAQVEQYLADGERLIMSDNHSLHHVYASLIEDPTFRTALIAAIAGIMPEEFLKIDHKQLIMIITYMSAIAIAATED